MDSIFILFAVIFTLLALVVATSLLNGSSRSTSAGSCPNGPIADAVRGGETEAKQNGHLPDNSNQETAEEVAVGDDWCEMSGSSHDHWDVVKSVLSVSVLQRQLCVVLNWNRLRHSLKQFTFPCHSVLAKDQRKFVLCQLVNDPSGSLHIINNFLTARQFLVS